MDLLHLKITFILPFNKYFIAPTRCQEFSHQNSKPIFKGNIQKNFVENIDKQMTKIRKAKQENQRSDIQGPYPIECLSHICGLELQEVHFIVIL